MRSGGLKWGTPYLIHQLSGIANFTSLLIRGFGYTSRQSLLLQMPHGVIAMGTTLIVGALGDITHERSLMVAACCVLPVVGGAILVAATGPKGLLLTAYYLTGMFSN